MEQKNHHIWITVQASSRDYQWGSDVGEVETSLVLPKVLLKESTLGEFLSLLIKEAVGQHELKKAEEEEPGG